MTVQEFEKHLTDRIGWHLSSRGYIRVNGEIRRAVWDGDGRGHEAVPPEVAAVVTVSPPEVTREWLSGM